MEPRGAPLPTSAAAPQEGGGGKKKKKSRRRRPGDPLPPAAFPPSGPPVAVDAHDRENKLYPLDLRILGLLRARHEHTWLKGRYICGLSAEAILDLLNEYNSRSRRPPYELEEIWRSLDAPVMRKYVYRKNKTIWALLTVGQVAAMEAAAAPLRRGK